MSYKYPERDFADGDHLTPHEMNAEMKSGAGEMNGGLDRDNMSQNVALDRFEDQTFNSIGYVQTAAGDTISWDQENVMPVAWVDIPDLEVTRTDTPVCSLQIDLNVGWEFRGISTGAPKIYVQIGIMVDGELVAATDGEYHQPVRQDGSEYCQLNCDACSAVVPVDAGTHVIKGVMRFWDPAAVDWEVAFGSDATAAGVTDPGRMLWVREVRR